MLAQQGTMADYELLELLLFNAIPRKDTKALAKDLLKFYGSFAKVISADSASLMKFKGVKNSVLLNFKLLKECSLRMLKDNLTNGPIISSWQALLDYCKISMGNINTEVFAVFYLNSQNELIEDSIEDHGTVNQISIYPREIAKKALLLNASSVILVHNHPGGNNKASKADIETTKLIVNALKPFEIKVHDHLIITDKGFFSFKANSLL